MVKKKRSSSLCVGDTEVPQVLEQNDFKKLKVVCMSNTSQANLEEVSPMIKNEVVSPSALIPVSEMEELKIEDGLDSSEPSDINYQTNQIIP